MQVALFHNYNLHYPNTTHRQSVSHILCIYSIPQMIHLCQEIFGKNFEIKCIFYTLKSIQIQYTRSGNNYANYGNGYNSFNSVQMRG